MHLQLVQTVNDGNSRVLEALRPADVVFLIETRAELHQRKDVLAVFSGAGQGADYLTVPRHAVKRYLDGNYVRILGCFLKQAYELVDVLIGVV